MRHRDGSGRAVDVVANAGGVLAGRGRPPNSDDELSQIRRPGISDSIALATLPVAAAATLGTAPNDGFWTVWYHFHDTIVGGASRRG